MVVLANLQKILSELNSVQLVAVTKYSTPEQTQALLDSGYFICGENKVQSAQAKAETYKQYQIQWHMLGHLQTNKAKQAVQIFEMIQSVDSERIAGAIAKEATKINKIQKILVQVNIGNEPQKSGVPVNELGILLNYCAAQPSLQLLGLMAMAPDFADKEQTRPYFKKMKELFDRYSVQYKMSVLSMGMSEDYPIAVQEGANMVRIGSKLFEE